MTTLAMQEALKAVRKLAPQDNNEGPANAERILRAEAILIFYKTSQLGESGPVDSSTAVDLLADLMHYVTERDQGHDPVPSLIRVAQMHFDVEVNREE